MASPATPTKPRKGAVNATDGTNGEARRNCVPEGSDTGTGCHFWQSIEILRFVLGLIMIF